MGFEEFRGSNAWAESLDLDPSVLAAIRTSASAPASNTSVSNLVATFKKSTKRDSTLFDAFKDAKQWENWRHHVFATARAHDIEDVLNSNYAPTTLEEISLFEEKQKFMHSIFKNTLKTDQVKRFVRMCEINGDV